MVAASHTTVSWWITPPKSLCPRGYPPACHAWRRVLVVLGDQVVQGVPLVPHLGHPSTERVQFESAAKSMARGRGGSGVCRPPHTGTSTHLLPLQTGLAWCPGEPLGPHIALQRGGVGGQWVARQGGVWHPSLPTPPPHLQVCRPRQDRPRDGREGRGQAGRQAAVGGEGKPKGWKAQLTGSPSLPGAPSFPGGPGGPVTCSTTEPSTCRERVLGGPGSPGSPFWPLEPG